jgi:hypothetical protein
MRHLLALAPLLLGGCVQIDRYPKSWGSSPVAGADCAAVAGTYANEGESSRNQSIRLATWLDRRARQNNPTKEQEAITTDLIKAQTIQVKLTGTVLSVTAIGPDILREWSFDSTKREFTCSKGVLRIPRFEVASDIVLLVSKDFYDLYRVGDQLVVNSHGESVGLVLIVLPFVGSESVWGRFPVVPGDDTTRP